MFNRVLVLNVNLYKLEVAVLTPNFFSKEHATPPPPRDISKADLGIWTAWERKSDQEVVREAALKKYVQLAVKFLSLRRNTQPEKIHEIISQEVFKWVEELLKRKLIFRVSTVLENIGLDPICELQSLFYKTRISDQREYIGKHLKNKEALPEHYNCLWRFLDVILENKILTRQDGLEEESIQCLEKKSEAWKDFVAAKLFLMTNDSRLNTQIKSEALWTQLLSTNNTDVLKHWIRISYSSNFNVSSIDENLLALLKSYPITENMIHVLANSNLPRDSFEIVLNELAQFGVFIDSEKLNTLKVLSRIQAVNGLENMSEILGQKFSNLSIMEFITIFVDYCLENNLLVVLNECTSSFDLSTIPKLRKSPHLDMIMNFRKLVPDFEERQLRENILMVSEYLSEGDLDKFFCDNPLIFLSFLLLNENISVEKCMDVGSLMINNCNVINSLSSAMNRFSLLSNLYSRKKHGIECQITYLDLVEKHLKINVKMIYQFRFANKSFPDFNSPELRENAYSKKLNYTFYLRQSRPYMACKQFYLNSLKNSWKIVDRAKSLALKKVSKIAMKNFYNVNLTASCVAFLEEIGVSSQHLRINNKAANILLHSGMDQDNVIALLLGNESLVIQNLIDENIVKFIDFTTLKESGSNFIKAVNTYEIAIKFSRMHNLPLPESFLRNLSQQNLWFPFLLYAEMKNYPVIQIKELCSHFKNPSLREHIIHSVMHDIHIEKPNLLMKERDSRKYLLSKLGVRRSLDSLGGKAGSTKSSSSRSSGSLESSGGSEFLEIDISNTKATLLQTLIRCHNSTDPPKALLQACQLYRYPLLAILATSYEPDSVITNWLTWLAVSTDLYEVFTNFESITVSSQQVTDLLDSCMKNRFPKTIFESCVIFIPDNPLTPFCDFLRRVIDKECDFEYLTPILDKFKDMTSQKRASILSQTDYELTYLKNKIWLDLTALQLLCSALIYNTESHFEQLVIVDLLCKVDIQTHFSCEIPDFKCLSVILNTIFTTEVKLSVKDFLDASKNKEAIENCVSSLLKLNLLAEALKVAECSGLDTDLIVLKKWQHQFTVRTDSFEEFLNKCHADFDLHAVSPELVISFFKERVSVDDVERYYLLKFSHKWASKHELPNRYILERKKIVAYIKVREENHIGIDELCEENKITYKEMLQLLKDIEEPQSSLTSDYIQKLENLLSEALDQRKFWLALKLQKMFVLKSNDLDILKLCHELAEGMVLPHQLNQEQQSVVARLKEIQKITLRRRSAYKSPSFSSEISYLQLIEEEPESTETSEHTTHTTLGLIHSLIEKLDHGSELAFLVFMKYRISCNIEVSYELIVSNTDPMKLLKDALKTDCSNKLEVVHDFLEVFEWTKEDITDFICDQFVSAATSYSKSKIEIFSMWDIKVVEQFHLILRVIKDESSTLGYKLYNYASAVHKQQATADLDFKISEMSLVVELLIASHSCFTADCNMEGISTILKKCRGVIDHLSKVLSWKLIVRLFTGIGRYTELNYVFDILKKNQEFEFLLKGSKRDGQLKAACIDYLKKTCPQDKQLYEWVAIHFSMYSEVASIWEREANSYIKNLLAIALAEMQNAKPNSNEPIEFLVLTKSDGTHMFLHQAMDKYVSAVEFHSRGEKLTSAMNAIKQAELLALQKSLLREVNINQTVPCLLNLTGPKIAKLMSKELNFHQSNILAQAYNFSPDWAQILYEQAILNTNITFFDQFVETLGITDEIIQDIARKFLGSNLATGQQLMNIKHILELIESLHLKYRLASELGFSGLALEVINSENIFYLKDTVWKSGYKGNFSKSDDS
ncbi:spatacsin isoform X2 [Euwallacea fornicatus]|uniref:spatacsin isoform X2 n=1 Tax=Euwallacea fornicatus TaxID=995702 RepID=UPI0033904D21